MGMAHRGRLNILANVVGKDVKQIFSRVRRRDRPGQHAGLGRREVSPGRQHGVAPPIPAREIVVSLSPNPSHLEAVDPVVEGIVRPKQDRLGDTARERVIPVLIHGDAAFAGQGVVAETLNLSQLDGYSTGGTIHLIINNQIGFTTLPDESRSTPVFHRRGARRAGADFPRQRRQSGGRHPRGADRLRLPPAVQEGRGDRHDLLSPPRPQRRRRPQLHAAHHVPQDQGASAGQRPVLRAPGARRRDRRRRKSRRCARPSRSAWAKLTTPSSSAPSATNCRNSAPSPATISAASARAPP